MYSFPLTFIDGHAIIHHHQSILLIDTGAPQSIHTSSELFFLDQRYSCTTNYMGLSIEKLNDLLGFTITTLLGADILADYNILFDYKAGQVHFSSQTIDLEGETLPISTFMGIPLIELNIGAKTYEFFLDTGAKISYLSKSATAGHPSLGKRNDFYPGFGPFETESYAIPTTIGNTSFTAVYGNLPTMVQMSLQLGGASGIMGFDFFNQFKVLLNLHSNLLKYQPYIEVS